MSDNQIYVLSQITCAMIEAMGMQAENKIRESNGESLAYNEKSFQKLIDNHGISHDDILTALQEG